MSKIEHFELEIPTKGKGFYEITGQIEASLADKSPSNALLFVYIMHTSASLCIQEAYDPTAKADMENFLERLVPENQNWHQHTLEGPDDTTSHLKSLLTTSQLTLAIQNKKWIRGKWQGLYLCEHRKAPQIRRIGLSLLISS